MALFSGAYLGRRGAIALVAPLGALLLSDLVLGFYRGMPTVYFSVALIVLLGRHGVEARIDDASRRGRDRELGAVLRDHQPRHVAVQRRLSAHAAPGSKRYLAAIPFFQNTLAGDLFFSGLLFGGFARSTAGAGGSASAAPRLQPEVPSARGARHLKPLVGNQLLTQGKSA